MSRFIEVLCSLLLILVSGCEAEFKWVNELPDQANPLVRHGTFFSTSMQTDVGYYVYTPPGYDAIENAEVRYPAVYFLHGGRTGSEAHALYMATLFNQWMVNGAIPPRLYIFPNGGKHSHYDEGASLGETAFIRELIPHIDSTYRTIAERSGRGLEGFSMGGRGTARDMFKYPDLFCSAVPIAGGHQHERERSAKYGSGTPPDGAESSNNSWDLAEDYASRESGAEVAILVVVGTEGFNYEANLEWMGHLDSLGISYSSFVVEGVGHHADDLYAVLQDSVMRFHEECFTSVAEQR